ncbi:MAG: M48 family metallopeptidase [Thermoplasmatales archaeon]
MVSKEDFKEEVWTISDEVHAKPKQIRVRKMKSKVGSCSPGKVITFDTSVLDLDGVSRREVIIHELLHLRYRNHGKMFKLLVKAYSMR